eukprot:2144853-Amphidinium_carterae.1
MKLFAPTLPSPGVNPSLQTASNTLVEVAVEDEPDCLGSLVLKENGGKYPKQPEVEAFPC